MESIKPCPTLTTRILHSPFDKSTQFTSSFWNFCYQYKNLRYSFPTCSCMTIPCDNNRKICLLRGCQFPCRDHGRKFNLLQVWISSMFYIEDGSTFAHKIRQHQFSSGFTPAQRKTCTITSCIVQVLQCCLIFWHICHNRSKSAFFGFYSSSKKSILFPIVYCKIYNVA